MSVEVAEPEALALLGDLGAVLDKLSATDLTALSGDQLLDFTREWERFIRRGVTVQHAAVAELDARHLAAEKGLHTTATLLTDLLRIDPGQARRRVRDARDFGPRRGLTGAPLPPIRPGTARALAGGDISIEHARAITDLFDHLPAQTEESEQVIEAAALDAAAACGPHRLRQWCVLAASRINPDGVEPNDEVKRRERGFSLIDCPDGWAKATGRLTPFAAAALRTVLGPLSAPEPAEDGTRDERTAAQRRHDGLAAACARLLRSGTLPDSGGATTTILATIDHRDLLPGGGGHAVSSYGSLIPVGELLRRAADAEIIPVVLTDAGGVMAYGRARRLATAAQRRALAARDGGCVRPGCTVPADWCEVHHVIPWQHGGRTDLHNLALVCPHDHDALDRGASVVMIDQVPHWVDAEHVDPRQVPRRNTAHHIPRLFDLDALPRAVPDP